LKQFFSNEIIQVLWREYYLSSPLFISKIINLGKDYAKNGIGSTRANALIAQIEENSDADLENEISFHQYLK
jgi:hypothetical protein